ncbi:MAG: ABC transporter transmembrane domain-containing protein, partial [Oribacterium sp.]
MNVIRILKQSIREYKRASVLAPVMVTGEVILECIIPFVTARLINEIKAGSGLQTILIFGFFLIAMAMLSLFFGVQAGNYSASASTGFAKNLRKDMYYRVQDFSFENIDHFETSSLVTRMTTDVTNVQMAYMMLVRLAFRSPIMLVFSFIMAFIMGGQVAWIFVLVAPILGIGLSLLIWKALPIFNAVFK